MRVIADRDICIGAGNCVLIVPEVFDQDDDEGLVEVIAPDPATGLQDKVREAVVRCPSGAIEAIDASEPDG